MSRITISDGKPQPPLNALWAALVERWLDGATKAQPRLRRHLAERYGVAQQSCATWATDNNERHPPWWVVLDLAAELKLAVVLTVDGAALIPLRRVPKQRIEPLVRPPRERRKKDQIGANG